MGQTHDKCDVCGEKFTHVEIVDKLETTANTKGKLFCGRYWRCHLYEYKTTVYYKHCDNKHETIKIENKRI
jgi:hypothetical protein